MAKGTEARARQERQARVSGGVWGLLLMVLGVLFMLDLHGRIDLGGGWRFPPTNAIDGNPRTRWASHFSEPQWIDVDLGTSAEIDRVRLHWEKAYATAYRIEMSDDGTSWRTAVEVSDGDGGIDEHELRQRARHLRVYCTKRATQWGFSLFEIEVERAAEAASGSVPSGVTASASSTETNYQFAWFRLWPLLLIASGLPLVLVPKDAGEQVLGVLLTGVGTFLQLQRLELVPWTWGQVWPVLLVVAGMMLVVQALRQSRAAREPRSPLDGGPGVGWDGK